MAANVPRSTSERLRNPREGTVNSILAHYVEPLKQVEWREQTTGPSASAVGELSSPGPQCIRNSSHDDNFGGVEHYPSASEHETLAAQSEDAVPSHPRMRSGSGYFNASFIREYGQSFVCLLTMVAYAILRAIVYDWTAHGWVQMPAMTTRASVGTFSGHWTRVLSLSAMILFADARALPPHRSARDTRGSDTAGSETHSTAWNLWVTVSLIFIGVVGGIAAWAFLNERARQIHAMFYVGAFTLVVAAAPVVLHQAGGIDAEINGPLWALWADLNVNFVLLGFMLVRKKQIGYPSPPIYISILAILWLFVFSATDKHNSRLYATLTTFLVTMFLDLASLAPSSAVQAS